MFTPETILALFEDTVIRVAQESVFDVVSRDKTETPLDRSLLCALKRISQPNSLRLK